MALKIPPMPSHIPLLEQGLPYLAELSILEEDTPHVFFFKVYLKSWFYLLWNLRTCKKPKAQSIQSMVSCATPDTTAKQGTSQLLTKPQNQGNNASHS